MDIRLFTENDLQSAGELLAARFQSTRVHNPSLAETFTHAETCEKAIAHLFGRADSSGAVAVDQERMVGFLLGSDQEEPVMGRTMWVRLAGHALEETAAPEIYRHLYAAAGAEWIASGYFNHYVQVSAADEAALWTWFGLGFGQQQVHACLDLKAYSHIKNTIRQDLTIRRAGHGDEEILAGFSGNIAVYQTGAPVWAPMPAGELEDLRQGYAELASDKEAITWLAFEDDQAVGMQAYFPAMPGIGNPLVPDNAIELKVGSTHPQARAKGIACALTQHA